jgi:3-hydroxyacyl-CoA dehydrogenase
MAQALVHTVWHGDVAVITLEARPANALGPELRAALMEAITALPNPRAMVLATTGLAFSGALPLDGEGTAPRLADLCATLADAPFAVVAAVADMAMGPGCALLLAADQVLASPGARFSLPEIALGLVAGGGVTQRLPRKIGARSALDMLLSGRVVPADEAQRMGLVDVIVQTDLLAAALALASELGQKTRPAPSEAGLFGEGYGVAIATARAGLFTDALPAAGLIVDAVEAAQLLPLSQGIDLETTLRQDLWQSDDVLALRAAAAAARIARRVPKSIAGVPAGKVEHLYLEGTAPEIPILAFAALRAGLHVTLAEADRDLLSGLLTTIAERQDAAVAEGSLGLDARDADWARLTTISPQSLLPQGMDAMVFTPDAAPRVSETASQAPATVPRLVLGGGADALGLTLLPSGRMSTLSGGGSSAAVATARALMARMGIPAVIVGADGPAPGSAIDAAGTTALARLVGKGVRDDALAAALRSVQATLPTLPPSAFDPRVNGGQPLAMPRSEIIARWWSAMAAAGLDCLAAGTALCPADIDHLMVAGYGFPRRLGGPMHQAGRRGLLLLRQDLRLWARDDRIWAAPPMLDRLISDGRSLDQLNPS